MVIRDGFYLIERSDDVTIEASSKTLTCYPYNNAEAKMSLMWENISRSQFSPSFSQLVHSGYWGDLWGSYFVQDDQMAYLTAYQQDGQSVFRFSVGSHSTTITKISLCAYIRGSGKTVLYHGVGQVYYGSQTPDGWVFDWIVTDYATNPWEGRAWVWSDFVSNVYMGVWLKGETNIWTDYGNPGAACRYFKVLIYDSGGEIHEFWPVFTAYDGLEPFVGNPLEGTRPHLWESYQYPIICKTGNLYSPVVGPKIVYDTHLYDTPPGDGVINSFTLSLVMEDTTGGLEYKLFVKIGANYYYGTSFYSVLNTEVSASSTWAVNPATSNAWTRSELDNLEVGYRLVTTQSPNTVTTYNFVPTISYDSPATTFTACCIATGQPDDGVINATISRIPKLEGCLARAGPHQTFTTTEHDLNSKMDYPFAYEVTELPPESATIQYVKVYYQVGSISPYLPAGMLAYEMTSKYKPFLEFPQEEYYYGTERNRPTCVGSSACLGSLYSDTWATNPATGAAWTYADLQILKFGVNWHYTNPTPGNLEELGVGATNQIYVIRVEIGTDQGNFTTDAANADLWGWPVLFTCDLHELPPKGSTINSVALSYNFGGISEYDQTGLVLMATWIYQNGAYYFDDDVYVGDPFHTTAGTKTWATNPATGSAWTYEDIAALKFGVILRNTNTSCQSVIRQGVEVGSLLTFGHINDLRLDVSYNEALPTPPTYDKFDITQVASFIQNLDSISTPDELKFNSADYLPERTEFAYFSKGLMKFHGIVTGITEVNNGTAREYAITAKSQAVLLSYRWIPTYSYTPQLDYFDQVLTIWDQLGADLPDYPFAQNMARQDYEWGEDDLKLVPGREMVQLHQTRLGILKLINSLVPAGVGQRYYSSVAKYAGLASKALGRTLFSTNHSPTPMPNGYIEFYLATLEGDEIYASMLHGEWQVDPDFVGGVHRLARGKSVAYLKPGEYYISGEDLYIHNDGYPDSLMVCIDNAFDTFLRPGDWELADYYLNVVNSFEGRADSALNKFFVSLGQETRFRLDDDAFVYIDAATEISRGSEGEPIKNFVHGENCVITVKEDSNSFQPSATMADDSGTNICQLETAWDKLGSGADVWTVKCLTDNSRSAEDLRSYLATQHTYDKTQYEITYTEEDYMLRPGDWISVTPEKSAWKAVRIKTIIIKPGLTKIIAGRNPNTANAKFGEWRDALGTKDLTKKFQVKEFTFAGASGSSTFVVSKDECLDWSCRLAINLSPTEAVEVTAQDLLLRIVLNGKTVPPGRKKLLENSASFDIDISDYCNKSTTSDTTNTIAVYLTGGTAENTVVVAVEQYKNVKELSNA